MPPLKSVGRTANSDASVLTKADVDAMHEEALLTPDYVSSAIADYVASANLVTPAYVDSADANRTQKTEVDAADLNYLPLTVRGVADGVASLDANLLVPAGQLPVGLITDRPLGYVEADSITLVGEQTVTDANPKSFQAASLTITDPGYVYRPLIFAFVGGRHPGTPDHSRRKGGASMGKMVILDGSDALYGGGVAAGAYGLTTYPVIPTAAQGTLPSTVAGTITLKLWLSLHSGTSYIFSPTGLRFFALVIPAS